MKGRLLGIKVLCILYIFGFISAVGFFIYRPVDKVLSMPKEFKEKVIKAEKFRRLNITSVDEFDNFIRKQNKLAFNVKVFAEAIISLVLMLGLWNLKEWSRIGVIVFEIYRLASGILIQIIYKHLNGSFPIVLSLAILLLVIFYLTRPNVKEQFN